MIKTVTLTYFRRHHSLRQNFAPGLNAIRAHNEGGKTTILEAIAYCLFGTKALRTSLDEAVTWGKPVSALKTEVVIDFAGGDLVFRRGKSGAEVLRDGQPFVTGQAEVSAYAATLFGVDLNAAARLMMANQNGLRGSLEQGPKATAEMIESLADFDLFERIITEAQEKLTLGPTANLEAAVERLSNTITEVVEPDFSELDALTAAAEDAVRAAQNECNEAQQHLADAKAKLTSLTQHNTACEAAGKRLDDAKKTLATVRRQLDDVRAQTAQPVDTARMDELRRQISEAAEYASVASAWETFSKYRFPEENYWENSEEDFTRFMQETTAHIQRLRTQRAETDREIAVAESKLTTSSVCGFCNQDVSQFPEVAARNAALAERISALKVELVAVNAEFAEADNTYAALQQVARDAAEQRRHFAGIERYVSFTEGTWPQRVAWAGPAISSEGTVVASALKNELETLEEHQRQVAVASGRLTQLIEQNTAAEASLKAAEDAVLAAGVVVSTDEQSAEVARRQDAVSAASGFVSSTSDRLAALKMDRVRMEQAYIAAKAAKEKGEADLARAKEELEQLNFNNGLLKKVRAARPIISDKLWNTVLAAVSTMFTKMRGEHSIVAKGKDGFTVNGQTVGSLSGSTLDLLGLAIRVALTKTFLPQCPLLILDEPFAACDDGRSAAMLGFIQGSGFAQIILVTHEDASETVADHLITLEAA